MPLDTQHLRGSNNFYLKGNDDWIDMSDKRPEQILSNTYLYIDAAVCKWQQDLNMRAMVS
jgi:hypothetical protein